jgi:hypothetical protein
LAEDFPARSLVYSVREPWRRATSLLWNATLLQLIRGSPLARVSIHPPDRSFPRVWRQIIDSVSEMQATRTATTYRDWIAEQRLRTDGT